MAHRFYRKHGRWEPYEEYLSAGQLAIAECLTRYDPAQAPPGGFLSYCCFQMDMKMRDVRVKAAGVNNMRKLVKGQRRDPKYTVEGRARCAARPPRRRRSRTCMKCSPIWNRRASQRPCCSRRLLVPL
jgi:hypothetical protein